MAQTEQKNQNVKKQFEELQSLLERAMALQTSMVLFEWDDETLAPKGAAEHTARVIGSLSEQYQEILASMRFKELLDACQKAEKENAGVFDEVQSAILREAAEEQERLSKEILEKLAEAVKTGDPAGSLAQEVCKLHRTWLCLFWKDGSCTKEAHRNMGEMYAADERFRAYYEKAAPGAAEFLRDALKCYYETQ